MRRRRRRQQNQEQNHMPKEEMASSAPSLVYGYRTELEGTPVGLEMEDSQKAYEMQDDNAKESQEVDSKT